MCYLAIRARNVGIPHVINQSVQRTDQPSAQPCRPTVSYRVAPVKVKSPRPWRYQTQLFVFPSESDVSLKHTEPCVLNSVDRVPIIHVPVFLLNILVLVEGDGP